ncbi:hypothetical protein BJX76DRAFT_348264 [Aspergillus varians]
MESSELTFLNTTGASLSAPAARRMRAHITRTNFAKRRQQMIGTEAEKESNVRRRPKQKGAREERKTESALALLPVPLSPSDNAAAFEKILELMFIEGRRAPQGTAEVDWFNLIASEPALVEATLAVAVRQWSPENEWQSKADHHSYTAVSLIKQRISSINTRPDGVIGAVITMAVGAALECDDNAWTIHMDGLAMIINDRESRDPLTLPSQYIDLVIHDTINGIFGFPRLWHPSIVHALRGYYDGRITQLAVICDRVVELRSVIDAHHQHPLDVTAIAQEIEEPLARLHYETRALRAPDNLHIDAAARAVELTLYLLWPSQSGAHMTLLAGELKDVMSQFPIKPCPIIDLTAFQLMVGAVAADEGSVVRSWFLGRILGAVRWMQGRGWDDPLCVLKKRFQGEADVGLTGLFKAFWRALY